MSATLNPLMLLTKGQLTELSTFEERFDKAADEWLEKHPEEAKEAERYCRTYYQIHPDADLSTLPRETRDKVTREKRLWVARTNRWPDRRNWVDAMLHRYQQQPLNELAKP